MNHHFLKNMFRPRTYIILILLFHVNSNAVAQSNPYNISTQRGAYFNFEDSKAAMRRAMESASQLSRFNRAKDAGNNKNAQLRNEYFFGYALTNAEYSMKYHIPDDARYANNNPMDTGMTASVTPKSAYYFGGGSSYPLATVSNNGALTLSVGLGYNFLKWKMADVAIQGDTLPFEVKSIAVSLPFTIDFKNGAEAMLDRSKRTCFTIGFGVQPTVNLAQVNNSGNGMAGFFKLLPAAKIEFGMATSFATFKLRATGLLGEQRYADFTGTRGHAATHSYDLSLTGSNQIVVALVIMPFTSQWENNEWYRGGR